MPAGTLYAIVWNGGILEARCTCSAKILQPGEKHCKHIDWLDERGCFWAGRPRSAAHARQQDQEQARRSEGPYGIRLFARRTGQRSTDHGVRDVSELRRADRNGAEEADPRSLNQPGAVENTSHQFPTSGYDRQLFDRTFNLLLQRDSVGVVERFDESVLRLGYVEQVVALVPGTWYIRAVRFGPHDAVDDPARGLRRRGWRFCHAPPHERWKRYSRRTVCRYGWRCTSRT